MSSTGVDFRAGVRRQDLTGLWGFTSLVFGYLKGLQTKNEHLQEPILQADMQRIGYCNVLRIAQALPTRSAAAVQALSSRRSASNTVTEDKSKEVGKNSAKV